MIPQTIPLHEMIVWAAILIVVHTVGIMADSTDGTTPLALKPGAPAGSYALSDFDNVNPYNGSLNFRLPLFSIGGRGGAGYIMTLPLEQKWRINVVATYLTVYEEGGNGPLPDPQVTYHYFPSANWWAGIKPGYGPGVMQGRVAQFDAQVCQDSTMRAVQTLTRLTFTAPEGTEFELQDKQTDGAPAGVGICATAGFIAAGSLLRLMEARRPSSRINRLTITSGCLTVEMICSIRQAISYCATVCVIELITA